MLSKKEFRLLQKIKNKYILRRVVFLFIVFALIISIFLIIFSNRTPESVSTSEFIESSPTIFITTTTPKEIVKKKIIIYHTHNDEAYYKGNYIYEETSVGRSFDENYNIIAIGQALKKNLYKYNKFDVIHDKSNNVKNGFNYAYDTSLKNIEKYIGNVDIFIDVHRDAYANTNSNYLFGTLNKEYAYIRFVVANGNHYDTNPNFNENYSLAKKLDEQLNLILPGISKGIITKDARLNQHISDACLLIEIGNEKNSLEQAINSTEVFAEALNKIS